MTRKFSRNSYLSVAVPFIEAAPPQQPSREELRAALEAELRAATREYEDELLAMFDRLPKWHTVKATKSQNMRLSDDCYENQNRSGRLCQSPKAGASDNPDEFRVHR